MSDNRTGSLKILDHKWLDPLCIEGGCQSLVLSNKIERLDAENSRLWTELKEANEVLRSCHSVAERNGAETNWQPFTARIADILKRQHGMMFPRDNAAE